MTRAKSNTLAADARGRRIDSVIRDPETKEILSYEPKRMWSLDLEGHLDN